MLAVFLWLPCKHSAALTLVQDVSVMGASLCALQEVTAVDPQPFKHLVPSLISILKQVCSVIYATLQVAFSVIDAEAIQLSCTGFHQIQNIVQC